MPEITVNGKRVTIREHFPARDFWSLADTWSNLDETKSYDEWAAAVSRAVTSWELRATRQTW